MKLNIGNLLMAIFVAGIYGLVCDYLNIPLWFVAVSSVIIGFNIPAVVEFK